MSKQTAVDLFHDRVNELIAGAKSINSNSIAKIWLECKAIEREQIELAYMSDSQVSDDEKDYLWDMATDYYERNYGKEAQS